MNLSCLGSKEGAWSVFDRMISGSLAYQKLMDNRLKELNTTRNALQWEQIPILTKKNFYNAHPWRELLPRESYRDVYSILRSSGTTAADGSNRGFFWPQLKSQDARQGLFFQESLSRMFDLSNHKTLAIVGLSLGSWAGGEQFSYLFKSLSLRSSFPLVVFSPGNQHAEILELIDRCEAEFDLILIAVCPSAIFYLERLALKTSIRLPLEKIIFLVTGEPFPEELRLDLQKRGGRKSGEPSMLSVYGAADTGVIGVESQPLIELRQHLNANATLAKTFGFSSGSIPNLYHLQGEETYFEVIDEQLILTRWQGLPLVRYSLEDRVKLFSWKTLCRRMSEHGNSSIWANPEVLALPDVVAVYGRAQGCLFLCGSNIFETMLQEALLKSSLARISTGHFVVWTAIEQRQQVLHWQIELKAECDAPDTDVLHAELVTLLSHQQPEFGEDYQKFYQPFEAEGLRIFQFHFVCFPKLSEHPAYARGIKRRIILEHGPL